MTTPPPTTLGREEALKWFLKIIDGAGGEVRSYDGPGDAANVFSGDFEPTDTWNWANERGLIETSFDSMAETSSARITDAGRTILAALSAQHEADRARIGELEACLREYADDDARTARNSYATYGNGAEHWSDDIWRESDPVGVDRQIRARALLNPEQSR